MRPIGLGLAAALVLAMFAPMSAMAAPKKEDVPKAARTQGMKEAPPIVLAGKIPCQVTDARFVGKSGADKKAGTGERSFYEVACDSGVGYMLQSVAGGETTSFTCIETNTPAGPGKAAPLPCILPGNADPKAALGPLLAKNGAQCTPTDARGIGQSKDSTFIEVACQDGAGYVVVASNPFDPAKKIEPQNCLAYDAATDSNVKCTLGSPEKRVAIVDAYAAQANNGCAVKERGYIGLASDGASYFEAACTDGKGYVYKVVGGALNQTIECAKAQGLLGGCKLTDARQAETEQAGLYTKLAKAAGSNCEVTKYASFPSQGSDDNVELACADGKGAVGLFKAGQKGQVVPCAYAPIAGYKCSLTKGDDGYALLTADLRKFDQKTCVVSNSRVVGRTAKGTTLVEVACSDGYKGYMIEYNASPVQAIGATGCAFAGGCKLPGNT